jgi:transcriptional regulator with XRE-family HTH domain
MHTVTGEEIRRIRHLRGWTQADLAEHLGYRWPHSVQQWERGANRPGPTARLRLADIKAELEKEGLW